MTKEYSYFEHHDALYKISGSRQPGETAKNYFDRNGQDFVNTVLSIACAEQAEGVARGWVSAFWTEYPDRSIVIESLLEAGAKANADVVKKVVQAIKSAEQSRDWQWRDRVPFQEALLFTLQRHGADFAQIAREVEKSESSGHEERVSAKTQRKYLDAIDRDDSPLAKVILAIAFSIPAALSQPDHTVSRTIQEYHARFKARQGQRLLPPSGLNPGSGAPA